MDKRSYLEVRRQLDFSPSLVGQVSTLLLQAATIGAGVGAVLAGGWVWGSVGRLLLVVAAFQAFAIVHDCGHRSFSRVGWINQVVGHLASIVCLTPFWSWTYIHDQHHVYAGHFDRDPSAVTLARWRQQGDVPALAAATWASWVPMIALSQQIVFATYPIQLWRKGGRDKSRVWNCAFSVVFLAAVYVAGFVWLPAVFNLSVLLPVGIGYLLITELINAPHHIDRPTHGRRLRAWEQIDIARSCVYPWGIGELVALNFNLHAEHHLFPRLPWYRLRAARRVLRPVAGDEYVESRGLAWVWKNRRRPLAEVSLARRPSATAPHREDA